MPRVHNYAAGQKVRSADLNAWQDQTAWKYEVAWSWRGRRPTLACDGASIVVGAHQGCAVGASQASAVFVADNTEATIPLSGLAAAAWHYAYAYDDGGACAYDVSTTAPDVSLSFKTGDKTRAYVGHFYALSASTARAFRMVNGVYVYAPKMVDLLVTTGVTDPTFTDLSLATWVPPHVRVADLLVLVTSPDTANPTRVREKGSSVVGYPLFLTSNQVSTAVDSSQTMQYMLGGSANADVYVTGCRER